ncbi:unnamed protein product, partial [Vitis vinifera]
MAGGRRAKLHLSKIYTYACGKTSLKGDHEQIGQPGFSRVVFCNEPDHFEAKIRNYANNYVRTTKYTLASFLPKSLFEQFRRVANFFFLVTGILSFTDLAPYSAVSAVLPLVIVIAATMVKEGVEDWQRKQQDIEVNNRKVKVHVGDGTFHDTEWRNLRVGDTNLKMKQALEATSSLNEDSNFQNFKAVIKCEDPNANLDSKLRNTDYIYGAVIFTGHDTKVIQNSTDAPSKRSRNGRMTRWYLRPDDTTIYFDPKRAPVAAILHFLTAVMLYAYMIPISLYTDKPAHARTSNLNEELGQVDTILSDKTGTLTCNSMEFIKCSVAGTAYGRGVTEVERAMAKRKDVIQGFLRLLAICHTAIPEVNEVTGQVSYEAESPDEAAFVIAARELGFEFYKRTQTSISLHELDPVSGKKVERVYDLLNVLEFNSTRKRMSVIVRNEEGKLLLLCKGADSVMFERLDKNGRQFEEDTRNHVNEYADAGLRTLILAYRELDEEEYKEFNKKFNEAKSSVNADREALIDEVTEKMEKNLILLGATAVEDKLQHGVPDCIDKLAQAGIKIWVLTGDKMETAINIGFACSLLRQGMKQIIISLETPDIKALEKVGDKAVIIKASKESVVHQIAAGKAQVTASSGSSEAYALIIDGKSLAYALQDDVKNLFLELAIGCASVICCRSSPKQKALVTRLVKLGTGKTTLAIGDGANDVGMLQEADIGIGISGVEGMQAVMSSDIAIAQFQYLERLLLVHGHWCYRRISLMICYFFYKNITFAFTLFLYEAHASFSGQPAYNDWFMTFYNVFFTSLPPIALGVFDQDVSARFCLKFPLLYQEGVQNVLFNWRRILSWMFNGVYSAIIIFFFCIKALDSEAFNSGGKTMALTISYFTLIQHIFIWGSIALWYLFLLVFGIMSPSISSTAYKLFIEALAPAPTFWIVTLFVRSLRPQTVGVSARRVARTHR